ncbi:MAG: hypothetical protein QGG39_06835 [Candidatus Poribacteria bacterium]|nr:hypothetical protein [Candidatus Poribacteria bacterium]
MNIVSEGEGAIVLWATSLTMAKLSSKIPSCQPLVANITCVLISHSTSDPVSIFDGLICLFFYFLLGPVTSATFTNSHQSNARFWYIDTPADQRRIGSVLGFSVISAAQKDEAVSIQGLGATTTLTMPF